MSYQNFAGYAGDLLAIDAYALLKGDSTSVLIDVRTQAEWAYVGTPDIQALGKTPLFLEWQSYPSMEVDPNFTRPPRSATPVSRRRARRVAPVPVSLGRPFAPGCHRDDERRVGALFQCVGWFRRRARRFTPKRRGQRVEGGRVALVADVKRRARLSSAASPKHRLSAVHLTPETRPWTCMTNPIRIALTRASSERPPLGEAWRRCCDRLRAEVGDAVFNSWFGLPHS